MGDNEGCFKRFGFVHCATVLGTTHAVDPGQAQDLVVFLFSRRVGQFVQIQTKY